MKFLSKYFVLIAFQAMNNYYKKIVCVILLFGSLVSIENTNAAYPSPPVFSYGCMTMKDIRIYNSQNQLIYNNTVSYCGQRQASSNPIILVANETYRYEIYGICYMGTQCFYGMAIRVWLDLNVNESFNDAGELIFSNIFTETTTISGYFTIPESLQGKSFLMRAACKFHPYGYPQNTGYNTGYGDYADIPFHISFKITTLSLGKSIFCAGEKLDIPFITDSNFNNGNTFIAQLSNSIGSFAVPLALDTMSGINSATFFDVKLPDTLSNGTMYRIRVIGTDPNAIGSDNGVNLSIYELPDPIITGSDLVCSKSVEVYYTSSVSNTNYNWFAEGGTIIGNSHNENLTVRWSNSGIGKIKLVKINQIAGCTDSAEKEIIISPLPMPEISGADTVCNLSYEIYQGAKGQDIINNWEFEGGEIIGVDDGEQVMVLVDTSGKALLKLIQTNTVTDCIDSTEVIITVHKTPEPEISGDFEVCAESIKSYTTDPGNDIENTWVISGGKIIDGSSVYIVVQWDTVSSGTLTLSQTNTISGCSNTVSKVIVIFPLPQPEISGVDTVCNFSYEVYQGAKGQDIINKWQFTGGDIIGVDDEEQVMVLVDTSGKALLKLIQTNTVTTCIDSTEVIITVLKTPEPEITGEFVVCAESIKSYTTDPGNNIENTWVISGGKIIDSSSVQIVVLWDTVSTATLSLTQTDTITKCQGTLEISITIIQKPIAKLVLCSNPVFEFSEHLYITNKDNNTNNFWSVKGGNIINGQNKDTLRVKWDSSGIGEVELIVTEEQIGCSDTLIQDIKIIPIEDIVIIGSEDVCEKNVYEYITGRKENMKYKWYATFGTIIGRENDTIVQIKWGTTGKGVVKLVYTDTLNGFIDSLTLFININPLPEIIFDIQPDICLYDEPLLLNQAKPIGGTYSGNGIESDFFYPIQAGTGKHEIVYSYTEHLNGCSNFGRDTITVLPAPQQPNISQNGQKLQSSSETGNQWYKNDKIIDGADEKEYSPDTTAYFKVIVTGDNGCKSLFSMPYYFDITNIDDDIDFVQKLDIFPNPAFDLLNIEYSLANPGNVSIEVFDVLGNKIKAVDYGFVESGRHHVVLSLSKDEQNGMMSFPSGMYYLVLRNNEQSVYGKFGVMR